MREWKLKLEASEQQGYYFRTYEGPPIAEDERPLVVVAKKDAEDWKIAAIRTAEAIDLQRERLKEAESLVAGAAGAITRLVQEVFMQRGEQATADIVMSVPLMKDIKAYNVKYDQKNDG